MSNNAKGKGGNLASRSLQYTAPETPGFLKALKAQVSGNDRAKHRSTSTSSDNLDSLLTTSAHHKRDNSDSDNDEDEAQVVVLNDRRHLTAEQAQEARSQQQQHHPIPAPESTSTPRVKDPTQLPATKRRRDPILTTEDTTAPGGSNFLTHNIEAPSNAKKSKLSSGKSDGGTLQDVKQLLRSEKQSQQQAAQKSSSAPTADDKRARKNKQAQTAKLKSGKGLSFSFDD